MYQSRVLGIEGLLFHLVKRLYNRLIQSLPNSLTPIKPTARTHTIMTSNLFFFFFFLINIIVEFFAFFELARYIAYAYAYFVVSGKDNRQPGREQYPRYKMD